MKRCFVDEEEREEGEREGESEGEKVKVEFIVPILQTQRL